MKKTKKYRRKEVEKMEEKTHRRRVHYSGTHPKRFEEKYKELNPEKYPETVQKVIEKGNTPAGMHIPIMTKQILKVLDIKPGENGLDCTLGYGGHTRAMLDALEGRGQLTALDIDSENIVRTRKILEEEGYGDNLNILHINFKDIDKAAEQSGKFDFVLADLGVSSMQIDDPDRGFSFKVDTELDLRLDPEKGLKGKERLQEMEKEEIQYMLIENSDEPFAEEIAERVVALRKSGHPVETTGDFRKAIEEAVLKAIEKKEGIKKREKQEMVKKSCQRAFQALRIDINNEYEVLFEMLEKLPHVLNEGARVVVLSFHSGEDRIVKKEFKYQKKQGLYREISGKPERPSGRERFLNPRSASTKLRWAIK